MTLWVNMNLPNKLTISRILLTFLFMFFLFTKYPYGKYAALVTFLAAALTDLFDGKIARARNMVTEFGKLMDPIADKVLVLAAFLAFVELGIIAAWMVVLIITREFLITGLRLVVASQGKVLPASREGKHKTASQMFAICFILTYLVLKDIFLRFLGSWNMALENFFEHAIYLVMLATVMLTLVSGASFLWKNKAAFYGKTG